jgi:predicted O-linked N-acetylglucosamine transferase (SPINDLY family)
LAVFALKPAPRQITYLGYPNTTGLKAMDYRIVDKNTDPDGSDTMISESPLYIEPCFLSYTPPFKDKPELAKLPVLDNGYITFGSFNNLAKISGEVIDVWANILLATPHSKLCLKAKPFADSNIKSKYFKLFQEAGVDSERLILLGSTKTTYEHLQLYNSIDIALDTFPYNGTTTTFEALWMGVPVVCIKGERHASRVSFSVIKTLGFNELVAADKQEYVNIACDFASNIEGLLILRNELRPRMSQSPLLDGREFTRKFESALLGVMDSF